jgi:tetratricopeptide (TPR) repeat protein
MNNDSPDLGPDLSLSFQDRIDILFHEIELAARWDRPSILFAIYKSACIRDDANKQLEEKLASISQRIHFIRTNNKDEFDFLSQIPQLPDLAHTVLLINGFNWKCGTEGVHVINEFNKHREYFIDNNIRAIFWLFEDEVSDFATDATECWILRHRIVDFVDTPQPVQGLVPSGESPEQNPENPPLAEGLSGCCSEKSINFPDREKVNVTRANALLSLGILFWRKGNLRRAQKFLLESAKIAKPLTDNSLQAHCHNALALVYTEMGNIDEAIAAYQQAISFSPESGFLWNNLGQILAKKERNDEAINAFKNALSCSPQDFLSWYGVGRIFLKLGVFQNAISAFEKALEIAPYYEFSWAGIGRAYMESGQLEKADESLRKAVESNVHLTDAWIDLGKCLAQQERNLDAVAVYRRAIEFNPLNADLWVELGSLLLKQQNHGESISAFQKAISLNPKNGEAYTRLAFTLFQIGDYETAASSYEEGIPLFEDASIRAGLLNRLGDTYLQMKDYEKSIMVYEQSAQLDPGQKDIGKEIIESSDEIPSADPNSDPEMEQENREPGRGEEMNEANYLFDKKTAAEWNEHGNSHLRSGAFNDAIVAYTKAIELAPDTCWPYIHNLAHVHYQKGKSRGKLTAGKIEDPDVWEGDDETVPASVLSYDAMTDPEGNEVAEEPGLEKSNRQLPKIQPEVCANGELGGSKMAPLDDRFPNQENQPVLEIAEEVPNIPEEKINNNDQALQTDEVPLEARADSPATIHLGENIPQNSIDWNELGNLYTSSKKLDNAIEAYKKAIGMNPKYGQPYSNLGYIYYRLGKYEVAIQLYTKSIDLLDTKEDKVISWNRLGDAYRRLGDYGNALASYQKASEMATAGKLMMARGRATLVENFVAG